MAESAPFIITTQLDLAGINAGLVLLSTKLAKFNAQIVPAAAGAGAAATGAPGGLKPKVIKDSGTAMGGLGRSTGQMSGQMRRANRLLEQHNNQLGQTSNLLGDVSRRVFVWGAAAALIFGALSNLKEFFDLTIDTNTAMAELRKVLPDESDFAALKAAGFDLSIEFGTAPGDVFKILKRFGQSGLEATAAIEATRTALLALNVTGADVE